MKIGIANDHAATEMKFALIKYLEEKGYEVINYGFDTNESCDYPIAGEKLANGIINKECDRGIAICGTGVGISIACNKVNGIRAGVCSETKTAKLIREHNDAQIVAFGARIIDLEKAKEIIDTFLNTDFYDSNGRHIRRINELKEIEKRQH